MIRVASLVTPVGGYWSYTRWWSVDLFDPELIGKQYATYIDLAKSKLINSTNYYLDLVGGFTTLATAK